MRETILNLLREEARTWPLALSILAMIWGLLP